MLSRSLSGLSLGVGVRRVADSGAMPRLEFEQKDTTTTNKA
jgi:hypothetical protein